MKILKSVINNGVKMYVVCHRVEYTLHGEKTRRTIDIATNLIKSTLDMDNHAPKEVHHNATEAIFIMNQEYIEKEIPKIIIPFIIHSYTLINDTGEILCPTS